MPNMTPLNTAFTNVLTGIVSKTWYVVVGKLDAS